MRDNLVVILKYIFLVKTLANEQLERQDFVDNKIFELIQELASSGEHLEWDIEMIGAARDAIENQLVERDIMSEDEFYPYIKDDR